MLQATKLLQDGWITIARDPMKQILKYQHHIQSAKINDSDEIYIRYG